MSSTQRTITALQTLLLLLFTVFIAEYLIMNLPALRGSGHGWFIRALLDASLLSSILLPITYYFIYLPQRRNIRRLEESEAACRDLESRYLQLAKSSGILAGSFQQLSGEPLLEAICQHLTKALSAECAFVGLLRDETSREIEVIAGHDTAGPLKPFTFELTDAPCEENVRKGSCTFPEDVCEAFLKAPLLKSLKIGGCVNIPLHSHCGARLGFLSILHREAIVQTETAQQLVGAFTNRIVSELEALHGKTRPVLSTSLYHDLFSSIRDTIIIADQNRTIIDANQPALRDMFGYELDDIIGANSHLLYAEDADYQKAGHEVFNHNDNRGGKLLNLSYRKKNGSTFPAEAYALKLMSDDGSAIGNIAVIRNISQRVQAEDENQLLERLLQQSQKMDAVGKLAGGVAHDFNNMLQVVVGYGEALSVKLADNEQLRSFADNILLAADKSAQMTRSLLAFSRKQQLSLTPLNLNQLIEGFSGFFSRVLSAEINFNFNSSPYDLYVMADAHQLEQVFMNLATNARDAMPHGGQLTISTSSVHLDQETLQRHGHKHAGSFARIVFHDSGCGISRPDLDRVFDPFFTTKEEGKGTGLGLAISFGIISQHKGMMHVSSTPGEGSQFYIDLPLVPATELSSEAGAVAYRAHAGKETILLAEDRSDVSEALATTLEQFGYTVVVAGDGCQALEMVTAQPKKYDLLLLDVSMPGQSGPDIFTQAKEDNPELKAIFLSGCIGDALDHVEVDTPGIDLLSKPVSTGVLLEKIRVILDNSPQTGPNST